MCNASGTSNKRIHAFGVPILTHQETPKRTSKTTILTTDRYDQYFQQLDRGRGPRASINMSIYCQ